MSVHFDIILRRDMAPEQITAFGSALWRWCRVTAGNIGMYQYVDNQPLADLIAGRLPTANRGAVHFRAWDRTSPDRQAAIDSFRWALPAHCVENVVVDGKNWELE